MKDCVIQIGSSYDKRYASFVVGMQNMVSEIMCDFLNLKAGLPCANGTFEYLLAMANDPRDSDLKLVLIDYVSSGVLEKNITDIKSIIEQLGDIPVVIYNFNARERVNKWIGVGVKGFLYNIDQTSTLLTAIKVVMNGQIWLPRQAMYLGMENNLDSFSSPVKQNNALTKREKEILAFLAAGSTNMEVANKLYISPHTVKVHVQNIYKKIGVPNRVKATIWANNNLYVTC